MFSPADTPELRARIEQMMMGPPASTANGAMAAMFDKAMWKSAVLSLPILGIYADRSGLGDRVYMNAHFPHMDYHEIPGTGHFLMLEKPAEFNRLLIGFLERQKD
jgi:pimeloyl-ACP methyl ester carboxylesterase